MEPITTGVVAGVITQTGAKVGQRVVDKVAESVVNTAESTVTEEINEAKSQLSQDACAEIQSQVKKGNYQQAADIAERELGEDALQYYARTIEQDRKFQQVAR